MEFPNDIKNRQWKKKNLSLWKKEANKYNLMPLEAKALHVVGTMIQIFNATGYLLYVDSNRPCGNYSLYAYLMACTAIELLGRCKCGEDNPTRSTLKRGFRSIGINNIHTNLKGGQSFIYDRGKLVALRNLIAHGQAVASSGRNPQRGLIFHVELLDTFPRHLMEAFDQYYGDLYDRNKPMVRENLAKAAVEPVLYSSVTAQLYRSPISLAYDELNCAGNKPSDILKHTDWQIYNPNRNSQNVV